MGNMEMDESTLSKQVLNVVLLKAWDARAQRVERVEGWVAERRRVDRGAITSHFAALAKGTVAEGATLKLDVRRAVLGEPSVGVDHIEVA